MIVDVQARALALASFGFLCMGMAMSMGVRLSMHLRLGQLYDWWALNCYLWHKDGDRLRCLNLQGLLENRADCRCTAAGAGWGTLESCSRH